MFPYGGPFLFFFFLFLNFLLRPEGTPLESSLALPMVRLVGVLGATRLARHHRFSSFPLSHLVAAGLHDDRRCNPAVHDYGTTYGTGQSEEHPLTHGKDGGRVQTRRTPPEPDPRHCVPG